MVSVHSWLSGIEYTDTVVMDSSFRRLRIPGHPFDFGTTRAGRPELPYLRILIAVPDSCSLDLEVFSSRSLSGTGKVYPIPRRVFERDSGGYIKEVEVFTYDTTFYQMDTLYPGVLARVNQDGYLREQRVLEVFLYPIQCNPGRHEIIYHYDLSLVVRYSGKIQPCTLGLGPFEHLGRDLLLNYPGTDREGDHNNPPEVHIYTELKVPGNEADYIIVVGDDLFNDPTGYTKVLDFANHRCSRNFWDIGIVAMEEVVEEFGPDSAGLHSFLEYAYEYWSAPHSPDRKLIYVILIGGWDLVPSYFEEYEVQGRKLERVMDYWFKCLKGDDNISDIALGRWPAKEVDELTTIVKKTIDYETVIQPEDWRRRGLVLRGQDEGNADECAEVCKAIFEDAGFEVYIHRWDEEPAQEWINNVHYRVNEGVLITSYFSHGVRQAWVRPTEPTFDTTDVHDLTNALRLPFVVSMACATAEFHWDKSASGHRCFGEVWLFDDQAGIGFYGAGCATSWASLPTGYEIVRYATLYGRWFIGDAVAWGELANPCLNWDYNLLGDPAVDLGGEGITRGPDLFIRPDGGEIELLDPYPRIDAQIPIACKIWNLGFQDATDVLIRFQIIDPENQVVEATLETTIDLIKKRSCETAQVTWIKSHVGRLGDRIIRVEADPEHHIPEVCEENNQGERVKFFYFYPYLTDNWPVKFGGVSVTPVLWDINGDGKNEILVSDDKILVVLNCDGTLLWEAECGSRITDVVVGDVDGLWPDEIVVGAIGKGTETDLCADSIYVYDHDGTLLNKWEITSAELISDCRVMLMEIAGTSPGLEIVSATPLSLLRSSSPPRIDAWRHDGTHLWTIDDLNLPHLSAEEIDPGNPGTELVAAGLDGIYVFDRQGNELQHWDYRIGSTPALADFDPFPDGCELSVGGNGPAGNHLYAFHYGQSNPIWNVPVNGPINSSPAVGDINSQAPYFDVVAGCDDKMIYAVKQNGEPLWDFQTNGAVGYPPSLANIDQDDRLEVICPSSDNWIYGLDGFEGHLEPGYWPFWVPKGTTPSDVMIGDLDGDSFLELVLRTTDGYVHVWTLKPYGGGPLGVVPASILPWPMFHHDYQRTGRYNWTPSGGLLNATDEAGEFEITGKVREVSITVYDHRGKSVMTHSYPELDKGKYRVDWKGRFAPGLYLAVLKIRGFWAVKLFQVE